MYSARRAWIILLTVLLAGCAGSGAFHSVNTTTVELSQPNYRVVARGISGKGSAWYLVGASSGAQTFAMFRIQGTGMLHQDALDNLWKNFVALHGKVEGRRLALANVRFDTEALNTILFVHPVVSVRADIVEFFKDEPQVPQEVAATHTRVDTIRVQVYDTIRVAQAMPQVQARNNTPASPQPNVSTAMPSPAQRTTPASSAPTVPSQAPVIPGLHGSQGIPLNQAGFTWIVASMPTQAEAQTLADQFKAQGFRTDVLTGITQGRQAYRVAIGHFATIGEAEQAKKSLPKGLSQNPWVMRIR